MTLKDIATQVGVSPAAVSTVLNNRSNGVWVSEATRQSVHETAARLGYRTPTQRAASTSLPVAVRHVAILCLPWYSPLFGATVSELCQRLGRAGLHPFIAVHDDRARSLEAGIKLHRQGKADALVMLGSRSHAEELAVGEIPCVVIGEVPDESPVWNVSIDNFHGGRLVGEHLWNLGHRDVGIVALADNLFSDREIAGLRTLWEERGAAFPDDRILTFADWDDLAERLPAFLDRHDGMSALFCAGDTIAARAIHLLKAHGRRVPDDLSVVGFDDAPLLAECLDPPLTTVRQPFSSLGQQAAQLLRDRVAHPDMTVRRLLLPGELVIRRSCRRIL